METQQIEQTKIKVGDLFYTSWGYDQTNYDFLVVVKVSPTGKTCICQMAELESSRPQGQLNMQRPSKKGFGETFRMKVTEYEGKPELRGSYPFVQGSKRFDSFWLDDGREYGETDTRFGH